MRRHAAARLAALLVLLLSLGAAGVRADAPPLSPGEVDAEAAIIFNTVMSPYCPGVLLSGCGSSPAVALRDSIKARLRRGHTREQVMDDLIATYGEDILGLPSYSGMGGLVWLLPGLALAFGLAVAYWWVRQVRRAPEPAAPPPAAGPADESLRRKLEAELQERT